MKNKKLFVLLFMITSLLLCQEANAAKVYSQSINVGNDDTTYNSVPIQYIAPEEDQEEPEDKQLEQQNTLNYNHRPYFNPYQSTFFNPYPYYTAPAVIPPLNPRPPHPSPAPAPISPAPIHPTGSGMSINTNITGHGYNFEGHGYNYGGTGIWTSRPVTPNPPPPGVQHHTYGNQTQGRK